MVGMLFVVHVVLSPERQPLCSLEVTAVMKRCEVDGVGQSVFEVVL